MWAATEIKNFDRLEKFKKKRKKLTRDACVIFFAFHGWKFFNEKLGKILDVLFDVDISFVKFVKKCRNIQLRYK